jgi:hypothetical protein
VSTLKIGYDPNGRVTQQTLPNGNAYLFHYGDKEDGRNQWVEIKEPRSEVTKVLLKGDTDSVETQPLTRKKEVGRMCSRLPWRL